MCDYTKNDPYYPEMNERYIKQLQTYKDWIINVKNSPELINLCPEQRVLNNDNVKYFKMAEGVPIGKSCPCGYFDSYKL